MLNMMKNIGKIQRKILSAHGTFVAFLKFSELETKANSKIKFKKINKITAI